MYDQEKEIEDKKKKVKKILTFIIATITIIVLCWCVYVLTWALLEGDKPNSNPQTQEPEKVFDPSLIPTYEDLHYSMGVAIEDIYGMDLEELDSTITNGNSFSIPNTAISLNLDYISNNIDLMALTVMALQRNPYAIHKEHPSVYKVVLGYNSNPVRQLPDGTEINLASMKENYTNITYDIVREDPSKIKVKGKVNGTAFEEDVNLSPYYQAYFNNN